MFFQRLKIKFEKTIWGREASTIETQTLNVSTMKLVHALLLLSCFYLSFCKVSNSMFMQSILNIVKIYKNLETLFWFKDYTVQLPTMAGDSSRDFCYYLDEKALRNCFVVCFYLCIEIKLNENFSNINL